VEEKTFRSAVRNNLSKVANSVGLDSYDRDELMDMAESDLALRHWKALSSMGENEPIPEWIWNQKVRAATRLCTKAWGRL